MYYSAPSLFTRAVTVRRHVLYLVPAITADAALFGLLLAGGALTHSLVLIGGGLLLTAMLVSYQYMQWRAFYIVVYADRILVCELVVGLQRQRMQMFAKLSEVEVYQNPLVALFDAGTLVLHTDKQSFTYGMLTPYTSLERAFGR